MIDSKESKPLIKKKAELDMLAVLNNQGMQLLRLWLQAAKKSGLTKEESRIVVEEAARGDFHHLVDVLINNSRDPD